MPGGEDLPLSPTDELPFPAEEPEPSEPAAEEPELNLLEDEEPGPAEEAPENRDLEGEIGDGQDEQKTLDSDEVRAEHILHHLPKDKNCPICNAAKMLHVPARKFANQSELRQHEQMKFVAKEPFDLLFLDLKIVKKRAK